jgi:hypothetical protein
MKKELFIHIEEPCHEKWNKMTAEEQGRFCHSCSKTVTDFSNMSDTQILKILSKSSGDLCGRFANDQLHRSIAIPATPAKKTIWAYMLSMLLPLGIWNKVKAQKETLGKPAIIEKVDIKKDAASPKTKKDCDTLGKEIVNSKSINNMTDTTNMYGVTMGLMVGYHKVNAVDTATTIVRKALKNEVFKIYPNPAVKGKKISIQVNKAGEYQLQLLDMESRMIIYKTVKVSSKGQLVFLDLPGSLSSGSYYIRLVEAGSNKQHVDKLVVK